MNNTSYRAKWKFVLVAAIASLPLLAPADPIPNSSAAPIFTQVQERPLGDAFMREIRRTRPLVQDPLINDYLQSMGNRLVAASPASRRTFHFFIMRNPSINAVAGPAGHIGVNSGLILATHSESELAAVLAHEIAHISQNHLSRRIQEAKKLNLMSVGGALAAALLGGITGSDVASGALVTMMGASAHHILEFSRSHEREADRIGMKILYTANFDPQGMPKFFAQMQKLSFNSTTQVPEFLRTHPNTDYRIADSLNRADVYPAREVPSSLNYYLMRERLRVNTSIAGHQIVNYYVNLLKTRKYANKAAIEYGYSLALLKSQQLSAAKQQIKILLNADPQQIIYQMAWADMELAASQLGAAIKTLKTAAMLNPDYYPLTLQYASTLIVAGHAPQASKLLRMQILRNPDDPVLYELLAQAEGKAGDLAAAYRARATALALTGNLSRAMLTLQQAKKLPNITQNDNLILDAKIIELKKEISQTQPVSRR